MPGRLVRHIPGYTYNPSILHFPRESLNYRDRHSRKLMLLYSLVDNMCFVHIAGTGRLMILIPRNPSKIPHCINRHLRLSTPWDYSYLPRKKYSWKIRQSLYIYQYHKQYTHPRRVQCSLGCICSRLWTLKEPRIGYWTDNLHTRDYLRKS